MIFYDLLNFASFLLLLIFYFMSRSNNSLRQEIYASFLLHPLTTISSFFIWGALPFLSTNLPKLLVLSDYMSFFFEVIFVFFFLDFCFYIIHRCMHQLNFLYAAHIVHHSGKHFNFHLGFRFSFLSTFQLLSMIPYLLFTITPEASNIYIIVFILFGLGVHCKSLRLNLGILNYFIVTPYSHQIHHLDRDNSHVRNFGFVLPLWDILFGTFELPTEKSEGEEVGVKDSGSKSINPFVLSVQPYKRWLNSILKKS